MRDEPVQVLDQQKECVKESPERQELGGAQNAEIGENGDCEDDFGVEEDLHVQEERGNEIVFCGGEFRLKQMNSGSLENDIIHIVQIQ